MSIDHRRRSRGSGTADAYTFFAILYFIQSVGDPTSGLIAQPIRSLLRHWGESPASLAALMALLAIPWSIKPAFGLLSDFLPLLGSRRRNYLLLANGTAAVSLLLLAPNRKKDLVLVFGLVFALFGSTPGLSQHGQSSNEVTVAQSRPAASAMF